MASLAEGRLEGSFLAGPDVQQRGFQHHGAILHNGAGAAEILVNDFGIGDEEVFLSFLPLSHAYEHSGGQFLPIMVGAQIYYSEGLEKLVSNIEETKPTIMVVVPRLFEVIRARMIKSVEKQGKLANWMLGQALRVGEKDYERRMGVFDRPVDLLLNKLFRPKIQQRFGGRMKALVSGGAPLNPEIGVFFHSIGLTLLQGYGQTEAGPVIAVNHPSDNRPGTVGQIVPGLQTRLEPVEGIVGGGRLHVRGPNIMAGYLNDNSGALESPPDGWHDTGDIVSIDEDGYVRMLGRAKRFAKVGGEMISLSAVEDMAASLWPNRWRAAVSTPDARKGERLVLVLEGAPVDARDLLTHAQASGLPEIAVPRKIIVVPTPILLGTGKTDYAAVQRIAQSEL